MAPSRRRGANKAKNKAQLSLGDLVLAKVKGHPFWPAKVTSQFDPLSLSLSYSDSALPFELLVHICAHTLATKNLMITELV